MFFALWKLEERKCRNENEGSREDIMSNELFFDEGEILGIQIIANKQNIGSYK
jgi:hypothetical protein